MYLKNPFLFMIFTGRCNG